MISVQTVIILDYSFWPITICIFNHYRLSTASEIRCIYMAWIFRRPFFSAAKCLEIGCTILPLNGPKIKKIIFLKVVPHFSAIIFLIFGPFRAKMVHPISRHLQSRKRAYGKFKPYIYIYIYDLYMRWLRISCHSLRHHFVFKTNGRIFYLIIYWTKN